MESKGVPAAYLNDGCGYGELYSYGLDGLYTTSYPHLHVELICCVPHCVISI